MAGFGGAVKLTGESAYKSAIKEITQNLTYLSSEMKVVNAMYDKNDTSTEALSARNKVLSGTLESLQDKAKKASQTLDEMTKKQKENDKVHQELLNTYEKEKSTLDALKNSTTATKSEIEAQEKKVKDLSQAVKESTTNQEANKNSINNMRVEYNKIEAEIIKTTKQIDNNTEQIKDNESATEDLEDSVDDLGDSLEDTSKKAEKSSNGGFTVFKGILANLGTQVINNVIDGIKKLGQAIVDLGKQAIMSYADYEQLVGGVETLFKDSAGIVEDYANNAYKTAGLSANEYMETVTSFSASLLQSLGGDTAKSAEIADMAITDMSDNANKMGTDIASIQNAYQGFAKQTYTMLDNLKLGYGGTKSEMERLLQDATAISGVEYDIESLSDVYTAIHIIQEELGITGTTAKEASTTISGSLDSMKSAWSNMLTGIADENANFDELVNNLVDSVLTVGDNLLPRIQTTIEGMAKLLSGLLTQLVPEIINIIPPLIVETLPVLIGAVESALQAIVAVLPQVVQAIVELLPQIITALVSMLPEIINMGIEIILSLIQGIASMLPALIPTIVDAVITIATGLLDNLDMIIDAGIQLIIGLGLGLINAIPTLVARIPDIIMSIINALTSALPKFLSMGVTILIELGKGIIQAIPKIIAQLPTIIMSLINGLIEGIPKLIACGGELLAGLFKGFLDPKAIWNACKSLFSSVLGGVRSLFGIQSPSKVFEEQVGKNLALGLGNGFEETMSDVTDQMASSIPTNFDINANANVGTAQTTSNFANMVDAFKQALKEVNIVLDDEVAGRFVTDTVERVVYS